MNSKDLLISAAVCAGVVGGTFFCFASLYYKPKSALTVLRDKPYFTGEFTPAYFPVTRPNLSPDLRTVPVMDDRYVVAPLRLENGKTGVSITPLARGNDAHWFELLDLDGNHTTVEKKAVLPTAYQTVQIPFVSEAGVSFTPVRMNVAQIPTADDHDMMQRLTKRANIQ